MLYKNIHFKFHTLICSQQLLEKKKFENLQTLRNQGWERGNKPEKSDYPSEQIEERKKERMSTPVGEDGPGR